ncbi:hypothetical protein COO72_02360 [Bifidobacterium callitrichos]|nr:hypothetical protein COO72_02360 [Bifidobacterium callitrichos]
MSNAWPYVTWRDSAHELPEGIDPIAFNMVASSLPWTKYNFTDDGGYRWATFDDVNQDTWQTRNFLERYRPLTIDHEQCRTAVLFEGHGTEDAPVVYTTFDEDTDIESGAILREVSWMGEGFMDRIFHDDVYSLSVDTVHDMIKHDMALIADPLGYEFTDGGDARLIHSPEVFINKLQAGDLAHIDGRTWILERDNRWKTEMLQEWRELLSGTVVDDSLFMSIFNAASHRGTASIEKLTEAQKELIRLNGQPVELGWN